MRLGTTSEFDTDVVLLAKALEKVDAELDDGVDKHYRQCDGREDQHVDDPRLRHMDAIALKLRHKAFGVEVRALSAWKKSKSSPQKQCLFRQISFLHCFSLWQFSPPPVLKTLVNIPKCSFS